MPAYWLFGGETFSVAPGALTAALIAAVAVLLMFLALRTQVPDRLAAAAAATLAFATPVWSIAADAVWPHTITLLGIAGMAWASATNRWWLAGIFGGITLWGRLHAAIIVACLGVLIGWHRRQPRITLTIGLFSGMLLVLLSAWTRWMYGTWDPTGSYGGGVFNVGPEGWGRITNQLGMWIALDRGILVWSPILLILGPALFRGWRELPDWARALACGGLGYTLVQAWLITFTGGDFFYGQRLGIEFLVCVTPALTLTLSMRGRSPARCCP